ncbi:MAG: arabinose transporter permease, partial [Deinococcus sp.]|nr:arabinose transporter permease [Deinococcus sp.]
PLLIRSMTGPAGFTAYDLQMAAAVISVLPLLAIFLLFQRQFLEAITAGSIRQ